MLTNHDKTRKTIYGASVFAGLIATLWFGVSQEQVDALVPAVSASFTAIISFLAFKNTPKSTGKHAKPEE